MNKWISIACLTLVLVFVGCSSDDQSLTVVCETVDPTGLYYGTMTASDGRVAGGGTDFSLLIRQSGCEVNGLMLVGEPLFGSGPFTGTLTGKSISIVSQAPANETAADVVLTGINRGDSWSGEYKYPTVTGSWELRSSDADTYFAREFDTVIELMTNLDATSDFQSATTDLYTVLSRSRDKTLEDAESTIAPFGYDTVTGHPLCLYRPSLSMDLEDLKNADSKHHAGFFAKKIVDRLSKLRWQIGRNFKSVRTRIQASERLCRSGENAMQMARVGFVD